MNNAIQELKASDKVPGNGKWLRQRFRDADNAGGGGSRDNKVTFGDALGEFRKVLGYDDSNHRCFIDPVFPESEIQTIKDIHYGAAINSSSLREQNLLLDAYLPPEWD